MEQTQLTVHPCFKIKTQTLVFNHQKNYLYDPKLLKKTKWELKLHNHSKIYRDQYHNQNYYKFGECELSSYFAFIGQLQCQNYFQNPRYWFRITSNNQNQNQKKKKIPYLIVDSIQNQQNYKGELLDTGVIFKLGKIHFGVITIVNTLYSTQSALNQLSFPKKRIYKITKLTQEQKRLSSQPDPRKHKKIKKQTQSPQKNKNAQKEEELCCRICLQEEQTDTDPLISPCKCTGSCRLIHLECLREWVKTNTNIKRDQYIQVHNLKISRCQICKEIYPRAFDFGNKLVDLITISTKKIVYLVLQQMPSDQSRQDQIIYFILGFRQQRTYSIGRGEQNRIRIEEPSLSLQHAEIQRIGANFYLRDCGSRFGTLIKIQKDYEFFPDCSLKLSVGRCMYEVMPMLSNQPLNRSIHRNRHDSQDSSYQAR